MRILLDESLPQELTTELTGHEVQTVQKMGWSALKNGELLARAAGHFDLFLTADQNRRYQQNLSTLPLAVVVLIARSNRSQDLRPLLPEVEAALSTLNECTLVEIGH